MLFCSLGRLSRVDDLLEDILGFADVIPNPNLEDKVDFEGWGNDTITKDITRIREQRIC